MELPGRRCWGAVLPGLDASFDDKDGAAHPFHCSCVAKWTDIPNQETRVPGYEPNTENSEWHLQGWSGYFRLDLKPEVFGYFRFDMK